VAVSRGFVPRLVVFVVVPMTRANCCSDVPCVPLALIIPFADAIHLRSLQSSKPPGDQTLLLWTTQTQSSSRSRSSSLECLLSVRKTNDVGPFSLPLTDLVFLTKLRGS